MKTNSALGIMGMPKTGNTGAILTDNRMVKNDFTPVKKKEYALQADEYFSVEDMTFETTRTTVKVNNEPLYKVKETTVVVLK